MKLRETHWEKGEAEGDALFHTILHWSFERGEGSIPFTRLTSPSFILNGLPMR